MKLIVLDLELNQPSNKIIQIGACHVDLKRQRILSTFNEYVDCEEPLNPEITELTGITIKMIKERIPAIQFQLFWEWVEKCKCGGKLSAWGSDVYQLKKQSIQNNVRIPKKLYNIDIKYLFEFVRSARGGKQRGGLENALRMFNMEFIGTPHNALDDAANTASLLCYFYSLLNNAFRVKKIWNS